MASSAPAPPISEVVIVFVFLVVILVRRTYLSITGARYSAGRLFGFTGFYLLVFAALAFTTIYAAISTWGNVGWLLLAPYAGVVVGAAVVATPYVRRIVRFEQRDGGRWYYQLPWIVPVVYLVLFVLRFAAELYIFGLSAAASFILPTSLSTEALVVLVAIDLLFGASMGILVGRAVGVYGAFRTMPEPTAPPASTPLLDHES